MPSSNSKPIPKVFEQKLVSRKEIAQLLNVSVRSVKRNEQLWGLDKCRIDLNHSCVRFDSKKALAAFRVRRFVE